MKDKSNSNRLKRTHQIPPGSIIHRRKQPSEKTNERPAIELAWRQNWPLLIGLSSVGFIAARLLGVATGDPETAYSILQAVGTGSVVVGGLIPAVGLLIFPLGVAGFYYGISGIGAANNSNALLMVAIGALAIETTIFAAPAVALLAVIAFTVFTTALVSLTRFFTRPGKGQEGRAKFSNYMPTWYSLVAVYSVAAISAIAVSSIPWVPSQNIVLRGRPSFSAFILAQTSQTTTILTQNPTAVVQLPSDHIISSEICKTPNYRSQQETVNQWLGNVLGTARIFSYPRRNPGFFNVKSK